MTRWPRKANQFLLSPFGVGVGGDPGAVGTGDRLTPRRMTDMATLGERVQAAWATGDPLALHREIDQLAAKGHSQQALEDALEALLLALREAGAGDDAEEIVNGVCDRLTGWCRPARHIETQVRAENGAGADSPIDGTNDSERKKERDRDQRAS